MTVKGAKQKGPALSIWTLAAFLLPAAALIYLFYWSQTSAPLTAQTGIQRAALNLERLAQDALAEQADLGAAAARARPLEVGPALAGFLPEGAPTLAFVPFDLYIGPEGETGFVEPEPLKAKAVWPLPGDELENLRYEALSRELEEREFIRRDLASAEEVLINMAEGFDTPAFQVRTVLARAAFLKRHGRLEEAAEDLAVLVREIDPAAASGLDELPYVVSAFLLLREVSPDGSVIAPVKEEMVAALADGTVPLTAAELRAAAARLNLLDVKDRARLEHRSRALDLVDRLREVAGLVERMRSASAFAFVRGGRLWMGGARDAGVRGLAVSADRALPRVMETLALTEPGSGLALALVEGGRAPDRPGEVVRTLSAPGGMEGAVLHVLLTDRAVFERNVQSRRLFVFGTALCLILAMVALGFATFRAVRREVAAAKARSDFMASVSHELRTPLASIRMFAELMEEDRVADPSTKQRFMRLIISNCRRLSAMIENVLDLSRSEKGLLRYQPEEVDLEQLVKDLFRDLQAALEEEGFEVTVEVGRDLPAVRADATALSRAVFNLCDNARKYSEDKKRIDLKAGAVDGGVCITVCDRGPGIGDLEAAAVFDRFQRGESGRGISGGAGLGLSLAREAIEACGGTLRFENREGGGAAFTIFIPEWDMNHDGSE